MSNIVYDKLEEIEKLLQEAMEFKKVFQDSNNAIANQYNFVLQSIQDTKEEYNKFGEDLNSKLKEVEKPQDTKKYFYVFHKQSHLKFYHSSSTSFK